MITYLRKMGVRAQLTVLLGLLWATTGGLLFVYPGTGVLIHEAWDIPKRAALWIFPGVTATVLSLRLPHNRISLGVLWLAPAIRVASYLYEWMRTGELIWAAHAFEFVLLLATLLVIARIPSVEKEEQMMAKLREK